jgi:hypothetical protein
MSRRKARILSYCMFSQWPAFAGEFHDEAAHHRYYGSFATNGGERLAEARGGVRPDPASKIF